ncbi:hypothetical protein [Streptomyces sp. NPDC046261]|uniref:hypothetical protein n=1 Tax=Streptomyces sp. NPDC046261 TaxID=3157200 RepID=UPI003404362E
MTHEDTLYQAALARRLQRRMGDKALSAGPRGLHAATLLLRDIRELLGNDFAGFMACAVEGFRGYRQAGGTAGSPIPYGSYLAGPLRSAFGARPGEAFAWACAILDALHTILGGCEDEDIEAFLCAAADAGREPQPQPVAAPR